MKVIDNFPRFNEFDKNINYLLKKYLVYFLNNLFIDLKQIFAYDICDYNDDKFIQLL